MLRIEHCSTEADEQLSLDVYNLVWPHDRVSLAEVHSYKASLLDSVDLLAHVDGELAGSAFAAIEPSRPQLVFLLLTVLAEHRGRGAGTGLLRAASAWARERGRERIEAVVADDDPASLAFAERRGFREERREAGVSLDLKAIAAPAVDVPEGIEIVTWADRPELARGMYAVACEAHADIPGSEQDEVEPFEDWLAHDMQGSGDNPAATFVAVAGDEVVGYAKLSLTAATPTIAHHDLTGVRRAWRGRGVARALKATQIGWAMANGYDELRTRNEERNAPIRHLNAEFGYRPITGRIYLVGPLAS
jgi:GNAT superfamily N-acetyltransferase